MVFCHVCDKASVVFEVILWQCDMTIFGHLVI